MDGIVAIRNGEIVARERGRGIGPALLLYRTGALSGAEVRDRIVGRAAAALFVAGGAASVHADVMTDGASAFLLSYGIPAEGDVMTPAIINRKGTGPCPMEVAVEGLNDPLEMVVAIERKLAELTGGAGHDDKT